MTSKFREEPWKYAIRFVVVIWALFSFSFPYFISAWNKIKSDVIVAQKDIAVIQTQIPYVIKQLDYIAGRIDGDLQKRGK
jgi:hypothetical protein